jgi:excisionase family DNA binding protein
MFFRAKQAGGRTYLQLVRNEWRDGKTRQQVIATLGRLDKLRESGELLKLLRSGTRFNINSINCEAGGAEEETLSTHQVGKLVRVSPSTVVSWTNSGKLRAFRTPGGHRRVRLVDLQRFLAENNLPVPAALQPAPGATRSRVFVVDDEPLVIRTIQRSLASYPGVEVEGCTDGVEALVQIGALRPDLVLLDVYMEGIDGFEVCRRLHRLPPPLAIVAMTAFPSEEDRSRILNYGALEYWVKPVRPEEVVRLLQEAGEKECLAENVPR